MERCILVRPSIYRLSQRVVVDSDSTGNYKGVVIDTHARLTKPNRYDQMLTKPGITVLVDYWDGCEYDGSAGFEPFEIQVWDDEVISPPERSLDINGEKYVPADVLYDRETARYSGLVPLPSTNLPGFCILFSRDGKSYRLRWSDAGTWLGEGLQITPGLLNGETDSWKLLQDTTTPSQS